jgi:hypothetical protein
MVVGHARRRPWRAFGSLQLYGRRLLSLLMAFGDTVAAAGYAMPVSLSQQASPYTNGDASDTMEIDRTPAGID